MAQFSIHFCRRDNVSFESVVVTGRKEADSRIRKINGTEEAAKYDYYYVKKTNPYGIKWVICPKNSYIGRDIAAMGKLPKYSKLNIYKLFK